MKTAGAVYRVLSLMVCVLSISLSAGTYGGGDGLSEATAYRISSVADLQELMATPADWVGTYFMLTADLDLSGMTYSRALIAPDTDVTDGYQGQPFTGVFDGAGHTIDHLTIVSDDGFIGLFGQVSSGGQIRNLSLDNVVVHGGYYVGGLAAYHYDGIIHSCHVTGSVSGMGFIGGLVGLNFFGTIHSCYAACSISGLSSHVGGLVGYNYDGIVHSCYASGDTFGNGTFVGGLAGENDSTIICCYATGAVAGNYFYVGGLVGQNWGTIDSCYATGFVSGMGYLGGLVGGINYGVNSTTISCFWDEQTSGTSDGVGDTAPDPAGVFGKTTIQMQTLDTFTDAGWDFTAADGDAADWLMPAGGYPKLGWEKYITFSPDGGRYPARQAVTVICSVPGAVIHYTTNGAVPTENDPVIASGTSILISKSLTLRTAAWVGGAMVCSQSADYVIDRICPRGDLNGDCKVDLQDLALLSQWWLEVCNVTNQWCGGVDLDASGLIDMGELEDVATDNLSEEAVAGHIKEFTIIAQRDYGDSYIQHYYGKGMTYDISIQVSTDATVTAVEFTTPAGNTYSIPATSYTWRESHPDGLFSYGKSTITPDWLLWEYEYKFFNESSLSAYGDGLYTFTVHYIDGGMQQSTAWFGIPDTLEPIATPTQIPTFTSFDNGDTVSSPVTFTWQACTDPAIQSIGMGIVYVDYWGFEDKTPTGLGSPVTLSAGEHNVWLLFDSYYGYTNEDGIEVGVCKQNQSHYVITVN